MKKSFIISMLMLLMLMFLFAQQQLSSALSSGTPLHLEIPAYFPPAVYNFKNNPLTVEGFALGRKLFYDGRLSKDGNFPCSSCHQQFAAFATLEHRLSHGFNNQFSYRNAPGLFNIMWAPALHWDGGINNIEVQPMAPISDPHEMAESLPSIISKIKSDTAYQHMFRAAYGDVSVTTPRILKALAQFTCSMISADSKYDRMKKGLAVFTQYEEKGYRIFKEKCASCHAEPLFTDFTYRNTGIEPDTTLNDFGRMRITGIKDDSMKFRVPSLMNVYLTAPYGHDGRFTTITAVLKHYNAIVPGEKNVDPLLKNGMPLSNDDRFYLISFLGTLTDSSFVHDARFADPQQR